MISLHIQILLLISVPFWNNSSRKFQDTICRKIPPRFLEAMAHFTFNLVARLPIHSLRRFRGGKRTLIIAIMGTMLLGGLWHGASWNFILWGFVHGVLLLVHRYLISTDWNQKIKNKFTKTYFFIGWLITQYFVFMTWLIFRLEDTSMMWRSLKTFVGYDAHWDFNVAWDSLPDIKLLTIVFVIIFIVGHGVSGKIGGFKQWYGQQNPIVWGLLSGILLGAAFLYRPAETIDFIYFRF